MTSTVDPTGTTLETERLRLRPFQLSDFDDYADLCSNPEVMRCVGAGIPFTREQSWRHMAFSVGHWQLLGCGIWRVEDKRTGVFLGRIGFACPYGWPGFELAWSLLPRWWGHGYATEGARAALVHAFTVLNRDRVISLIQPDNLPSIRVAERIGQSPGGSIEMMGKEYIVYGVDRATWTEVAPGYTSAS